MSRRFSTGLLELAAALVVCGCLKDAVAETRCVAIECYVRSSQQQSQLALEVLEELVRHRQGIALTTRDIDGTQAEENSERLRQVAAYFHLDAPTTPLIYGCRRAVTGSDRRDVLQARISEMLRIDVFVRSGCPRCARAKVFIEQLTHTYPGLEVRTRDIVTDREARSELEQLTRRHQQAASSVPVFHLCDQLVVGFDNEATTGKRVHDVLAHWTYACRPVSLQDTTRGPEQLARTGDVPRQHMPSVSAGLATLRGGVTGLLTPLAFAGSTRERSADPPPSPPPPRGDGPPRPGPPRPLQEGTMPPTPGASPLRLPDDSASAVDVVEVPLFGPLSASRLGLPLFTIGIGLVDGFNPCAMWVLLFLLSILVNLQDRWKILTVAGVFVAISGLAYFAFMAAWLNVFLWVGLLRPIQVTLAVIAMTVGAIHIKDFFALKRGVSLSIPEAAKPGIYARVRRIVMAENLLAAVAGASVLAIMVNLVELLCTAGLPALYTEILTLQHLPVWKNFSYLALYNVAYMFDDAVMVAVVVTTLERRKMQEQHGRVLKLVSGLVIFLLGVVMLFKPEWLV